MWEFGDVREPQLPARCCSGSGLSRSLVAAQGHSENRQGWEKPPEPVSTEQRQLPGFKPTSSSPKQFVCCGTLQGVPCPTPNPAAQSCFWDFIRMAVKDGVHCWGQNGWRWSCSSGYYDSHLLLTTGQRQSAFWGKISNEQQQIYFGKVLICGGHMDVSRVCFPLST